MYDYIKLVRFPDQEGLADKLTESLDELVAAFPRVETAIMAQQDREAAK